MYETGMFRASATSRKMERLNRGVSLDFGFMNTPDVPFFYSPDQGITSTPSRVNLVSPPYTSPG